MLGRLEVVDGDRHVALPRGHARALLALLALRAGEVVSAEVLIDQLWGGAAPSTAVKALHGLVSILRQRLEPDRDRGAPGTVLLTRAPGYVLMIDREQVDVHRFRRLAELAADAPPASQAALLREALGLWRGPALDDFAYEPFAQGAIADLEELRLTALEQRVEVDLASGRHAELVAELEVLAAEHPLRERFRGQLMVALYRCGRQAEALEAYRAARRLLADELGIDPSPALQALEQAILRQDAALDVPVQPPPVAEEPDHADDARWLVTARRTVTVVFVDLSPAASTQDAEDTDPEAARPVVRRAYQIAADALGRHGGTIEGLVADVAVAVFGLPVAHEDDATRAVRAAVELRHRLTALNEEVARVQGVRLAARAGIATGEIVVGAPTLGGTATSGPPVVVAARLQQFAGEQEVLASERTVRLVGDAAVVVPLEAPLLDSRGRAVAAWRVLDMAADVPSRRPPPRSAMLGRTAELARLRALLRRTERKGRATLVTLVGDAGIGKSRLAAEFGAAVRPEADVLTGHCPPYGEGITFFPLREIVVEAAGSGDPRTLLTSLASVDDVQWFVAQVAAAVGLTDTPGRPDDLLPAFRRLFEALARKRPLVVVFEDVHWAQPTLLELIEYLAATMRGPVVLLCLGRPEFLEQWPRWAEDLDDAHTLRLSPLDDAEVEQLIVDRSPGGTLLPETMQRVVEMAQGNPLFVEQFVAALREGQEPSIPPSVQALMVARLDRLGPAERDLIRSASVLGPRFGLPALSALLPERARPSLRPHLEALVRKELLVGSGGPVFGGEGFMFRHVLIQMAAYQTLTKDARATLHERAAAWLETGGGGDASHPDEVTGYHLEQAHRYRRELGARDTAADTLAVRAGERLASAGVRAFGRFDATAAENLLLRADRLLPAEHPRRRTVQATLAESYQVMGRHHDADEILAQLADATSPDADAAGHQLLLVQRAMGKLATGPDPVSLDTLRDQAMDGLAAFEATRDQNGLAHVYFLLTFIHLRRGEPTEAEAAARQALVHADRSGKARGQLGARWAVAMAVEPGPTPVEDCIRVCDELLWWRGTEHPGVLSELAYLRAMLGEFDRARQLVGRARRILAERVRARRPLGGVTKRAAEVEHLTGDSMAAEQAYRSALEVNAAMSERDPVSQITARLSLLLCGKGRTSEAESFADLSKNHAPAESVAAQALWRAARARVLAASGNAQQARTLGQEAVGLVAPDMVNLGADLRVELARILGTIGQHDGARKTLHEAIDLYQRKGNLVGAHRVAGLAGIGGPRRRGTNVPRARGCGPDGSRRRR